MKSSKERSRRLRKKFGPNKFMNSIKQQVRAAGPQTGLQETSSIGGKKSLFRQLNYFLNQRQKGVLFGSQKF
jgi:hypothetical protein